VVIPVAVELLAYVYARAELILFLERIFSPDRVISLLGPAFFKIIIITSLSGGALSILILFWKKVSETLRPDYWKSLSGSIKILILTSALIILMWLFLRDDLPNLYREDGLLETMTALLFLAAGLQVGIRVYFFQDNRNPWYLLIASLFLFVGLEEISWGQRIFGWTTPDWFSGLNVQGETNFHNLIDNRYLNQFFALGLGYLLIAEGQIREKLLSMPSMAKLAQTMPGEEYKLMGLIFLGFSAISVQALGNEVIEEVLALFAFSYSLSVPQLANN